VSKARLSSKKPEATEIAVGFIILPTHIRTQRLQPQHVRMEPALGQTLLDFVHVDGVHDDNDVGLVFLEEGGIHILLSNAGNIVALHVRVDVAHMLDDANVVKLRKETD